jgi:hypothetical protein
MSFDENQLDGSPYASPANPPAKQGTSNLLIFAGCCLIGLAIGLAAAHEYSPAVDRIAAKLAARGLGWDVVGALGATLFGLGLVGRGNGRLGARIEGLRNEQIDLALLQERVVGELADLRASSDRHRLSAPVSTEVAALAGAPASGQGDKEALYRMAASLDQLSGRLEKRVQADLASLAKELERVSAAIGKLEQRIGAAEKRPAAAAPKAAAPAGKAPAAAPPVPAAGPFAPVKVKDEDGPIVIDLDAQERALELFDRMDDPEGEEDENTPLHSPAAPLPGKRGNGPVKAPAKELERLRAEQRARESRG